MFNKFASIYGKAQNFYLSKSKKGRIIIVCGAGVVIGLIILFFVYLSLPTRKLNLKSQHTVNKVQSAKEASAARQMQTNATQSSFAAGLQNQLQQIQKAIADSSLSQNKINDFESQISVLASNIKVLQENANATKEAALKTAAQEQAHADIENYRTGRLQAQLTKLSKAVIPQKYLPASILPFKVVGLDFWNGKPMVSIAIKDVQGVMHYTLMGQDMRYSFWAIRKINTSPKEAIFVNNKNQYVKVEL
jgi:hypothetical protein